MSILAENIKYCRERKGMTQEELAKHFGLSSYKTVQKWEHDIVNPRAITISELSKLFGETMQDLYTRSINCTNRNKKRGTHIASLALFLQRPECFFSDNTVNSNPLGSLPGHNSRTCLRSEISIISQRQSTEQ